MEAVELIVLVVVVLLLLLAVAAAAVMRSRKRRSQQLQSEFGPEYDRTLEATGKRSQAERELAERRERRRQLDIRALPPGERTAFAARWRETQEQFVDDPSLAVREADRLVAEVMGQRGYPVEDFEQQARDVSVDHPEVVQEYRAAHDISELNDREQASTEQLRQAMVHYRALFTELLEDGGDHTETRPAEHVDPDRPDVERVEVDRERVDLDRDDRERGAGADMSHADAPDRPASARQRVVVERLDGTGLDVSRADGERVQPGGLRAETRGEDGPPRH